MHIRVYMTPLAPSLPRRAHASDAGYDLATAVDFTVGPGQPVKVPTGLVFDLPEKPVRISGIPHQWILRIEQRTGKAGEGLIPAATIVDAGYRPDPDDEHGLTLLLRNIGTEALTYPRGTKVAQGIFELIPVPELRSVPKTAVRWDTPRGSKRFGATGA